VETAGPGWQQAAAAAARRLAGCARRPGRGAPAPLRSALPEMFGWVRHCRYPWQLAELSSPTPASTPTRGLGTPTPASALTRGRRTLLHACTFA